MNILQVAAFTAEFSGNFIYSLEQLEMEAKKLGHKTYYVFPETAKDHEWCKNIKKRTKVFFLPLSKARIKPKTYFKLSKICKNLEIDIVHSHFELYDMPCLYASYVLMNKQMRVIWHIHDSLDFNLSIINVFLNKIQYKYFGKKVKIICITDNDLKKLRNYGVKENNIKLLHNGININKIILKEMENCIEEFNFLTIGGNYNRKGIDLIIKACQMLEKENYSFKILICGNQTVKKELQYYFHGEFPSWLTFEMPVLDVNLLFKKSRTYIQASRYETFSYAVCESAYSGMNVFISNIDGMKWAHELPTVKIFESENVNELYNLMKLALLQEGYDLKNISKTRKIIQKKYLSNNWTKEVLNLYEKK